MFVKAGLGSHFFPEKLKESQNILFISKSIKSASNVNLRMALSEV